MLKLGIIGFGNMASMIFSGLLDDMYKNHKTKLLVYTPNPNKRVMLSDDYGVTVKESSQEVYKEADVVLLGVKPQKLSQVVSEIGEETLKTHQPLVLSILAGVSLAKLEELLTNERVVRIMPNTAASLGMSMTTLSKKDSLSDLDSQFAKAVFDAVGETMWLDEGLLDISSAINGSSPAFLYVIAEALADGAVANGLSRDVAETLVANTFLGVGKMLKESGQSTFDLRVAVSSPAGTTVRGLEVLEKKGVRHAIAKAITKTKEQSEKLGREA